MGDVYLSHGISRKGCLTSADADANLALIVSQRACDRFRKFAEQDPARRPRTYFKTRERRSSKVLGIRLHRHL